MGYGDFSGTFEETRLGSAVFENLGDPLVFRPNENKRMVNKVSFSGFRSL